MQDIYRRIKQEYENNRSKALFEVEKRKKEIYAKEPVLSDMDEKIQKTGIEITKSLIFIDDDIKRQNIIEELNDKIDKLKEEKNNLLKSFNLPEDYFKPKFLCKVCEDTGIIGTLEGAKNCNCFRQKLIDYTYNQSQLYNLEKENFSMFDENIFSDKVDESSFGSKKSPRENILFIREIAEKFVEKFDSVDTKNLMFVGGTGLGKTFLSNCIAKEVLDRGKTVLYQTAGRLMDLIMTYRKDGESDKFDASQYEELFNVDLLIIDDLGTENITEARRAESFNILNTRLLNSSSKGIKTLISTNRELKELVDYYDQRIVSRILGNFEVCRFFGNDIRLERRKK